MGDPFFIGFDFSTQQVKAVVIDSKLKLIAEQYVTFDRDLPEFRTQGGVVVGDDALTVTAPVVMWLKALDLLIDQLKVAGVCLARVAAIGGVAQHGSVYWRQGAERLLSALSDTQFLHTQLESCFSVRQSPVWRDCSTAAHCRKLQQYVGGAQKLANITGSRAYERFTGGQIAKLYHNNPEAYRNTERISLVSSFVSSLFLGRYADIDLSDGSGMNLLDISTHKWSQDCLDGCAPGLAVRLGSSLVAAGTDVGGVSEYWSARHGFSRQCRVAAFTGDNPGSVVGLRLRPGHLAISLGTSDTVFAVSKSAAPVGCLSGHVFVSPLQKNGFMSLLCFKNGSLVRERVRDAVAGGCWRRFQQLLDSTPPGNGGNIGVFWDEPEITPSRLHADDGSTVELVGCLRWTDSDTLCDKFDAATEVRALIEGQMMAKRLHARNLGFSCDEKSRVLVTGGASTNNSILQVIADVFNAPVYTHNVTNSACLGAAYLAWSSCQSDCNNSCLLDQLSAVSAEAYQLACKPRADAESIYTPLLLRYASLEKFLLSN